MILHTWTYVDPFMRHLINIAILMVNVADCLRASTLWNRRSATGRTKGDGSSWKTRTDGGKTKRNA